MIRSMTGYGRGQQLLGGRDIAVEIKAVNHRFYEFSARTPRMYGFLEEKLKSHVQGRVARGKVEVGVTIFTTENTPMEVQVNHQLAQNYLIALRQLGQELGVVDDLCLSQISRLPDIFVVQRSEDDEGELWAMVRQVADEALEKFVAMRETEGAKMKEDLENRLAFIEEKVAQVKEQSPKTTKDYRNRLYAKLCEVLGDSRFDETRLITEAAIFAEKVAVDEETVRLESHLAQFHTILESGEPVGRKLDFLVQEINREVNTIGSKAQDAHIAKVVVALKSEIEKIREQIQNIE